ncbi:MAG: hypothetical protein ABR978_09325 [Dehalococcoidia bacterium]
MEAVVSSVTGELSALVRIAMAGLLGAGVLVMYWTMVFWVNGWRADPKFNGMGWDGWLVLSTFGIGLISVLAGIVLSLNWLARARRAKEALFWSISSVLVLALTFVATVANILER